MLAGLNVRGGPEDERTGPQRDHDALEEACRRLIGAGGLPDRAGQPVQIQLHLTLDQLCALPGSAAAEAAWAATARDRQRGQPRLTTTTPAGSRSPAASPPGPCLGPGTWALGHGPAAPPGADCDATVIPVVTGHLDHALLTRIAEAIAARGGSGGGGPGGRGAAWRRARI